MNRFVVAFCFALLLVAMPLATAQSLSTRWAAEVDANHPLPEYPRPTLVRERWQNLNGKWNYAIRPRQAAQPKSTEFDGSIVVPFPIESALSGVKKNVGEETQLWYRRNFAISDDWRDHSVVLHFGAVDWDTTVWVNGKKVGTHQGGYDPFSFDVTSALKDSSEQELVVAVWDPTDVASQPRGKQIKRPHGIWYTAVTGIWQTVWLEPLPRSAIQSVKIDPQVDLASKRAFVDLQLSIQGADPALRARVTVPGQDSAVDVSPVADQTRVTVEFDSAKLWSPDSPHLYDVKIELLDGDRVVDSATSYFALRTIEMKQDTAGINRMFLNGESLFQFGPLDQGWWPDGLYTAPTDAALKYDIEMTRKLGFNMCRKHVKVEPARWYYWADKLGLLVWQDMPSGMTTGRPHGIPSEAERDAEFSRVEEEIYRREWKAIIDAVRHHPCIVVWVPFNEGWGQHDTNEILKWTKQYDPTRLVDGPSGWVDRGYGDMKDMHRYPAPGMFPVESDRISVLGEFGGLGLPLEGHTWLNRDNWGYRTYTTKEELLRQYERLIDQLPSLISRGLAAAVYTQTTDVEVEVNGLMTYDRAVMKMPVERLAKLHEQLYLPPGTIAELVPTSEKTPQQWRYTTKEPTAGWERPDFDDSSWQEGEGGFGTKGTPGAIVRTTWNNSDIWLRRTIELPALDSGKLLLRIHHDENTEIFLDGEQIASVTGYTTDYLEVPLEPGVRDKLKPGRKVLAIHCKQTGGGQYIDAGFVVLRPGKRAEE